jgi:hypothetical protein
MPQINKRAGTAGFLMYTPMIFACKQELRIAAARMPVLANGRILSP